MSDEESTGTVLVALAANLGIAVAKIAAGLLGGSSAMLAEGAHSVADTTNQVFLLISLRLSRKPAGRGPPVRVRQGAVLLVAAGRGRDLRLRRGLLHLRGRARAAVSGESEVAGYLLAYVVLGVSFVLEGTPGGGPSGSCAARPGRSTGRCCEHVRLSSDPTVKTVFSEDTAALIGLVLAAARPRPCTS